MGERVVITGLGVVSSIGIGKDAFWSGLTAGKSGISEVGLFDTSKFKRHYAGEIKDFDPSVFIRKSRLKLLGRTSQLAIAAAKLALEDAGMYLKGIRKKETAIVLGVTMPEGSELESTSEKLLRNEAAKITAKLLLNDFPPSLSRNVGLFFKTEGINVLIPTACAAGNYSIGYGCDLIKQGSVDWAIVGGAESLSRVAFQGFQKLYAMAHQVCAPFDKNRKGMLLGEGAGILIIESLSRAEKRKARIYAEVLGYGLSCDAFHITIPKRDGIKKAMAKALKNAGVLAADVDYISAHGTGTVQNDKEESAAIKEVFGDNYKKVPVSSIKSMLGHCMGASSSMAAIACCLAMRDSLIPPTMNFLAPDLECDIDCVPNAARYKKLNTILSNAFAFGGNNCCLVMGKHK